MAILTVGTVLLVGTAYAQKLTGKAVGVHDGDTVTILDAENTQHKVRVGGIDAPELKQPFGAAAKKNLSDLFFGRYVVVAWNNHDRDRRIVGKVLLPTQLA